MMNIQINGKEKNNKEMNEYFDKEIQNENHTSIEKFCLKKVRNMLNSICGLVSAGENGKDVL